jgi:predicted Fe-Mo cluster-binding NifX family protein
MGVDVLLCGAIGKDIEEDIRSRGIEVVSGLAGEVAEVVAAFRCQALGQPRFRVPGVQAN